MSESNTPTWSQNYESTQALDARHRAMSTAVSTGAFGLDLLPPNASGLLADVGCGTGVHLQGAAERSSRLRLVAMDLSQAMVRHSAERVKSAHVVRASVEALPLATDACDYVLCFHVLYHVSDIPRAVAELARVVKPVGLVLITTVAATTSWELLQLHADICAKLGLSHLAHPVLPSSRFNTMNGTSLLGQRFKDVRLHTRAISLTFHTAEKLLEYYKSMEYYCNVQDALGTDDGALPSAVRNFVAENNMLPFRVTKDVGTWTARPQA